MKTIGLIGGMSWESSLEYYRILNEKVKKELGGLHSAKTILYSVDFEEIKNLQHESEWGKLTEIMIDAAKSLERAGAEMIVICTNTMHKMAPDVENNINLPLIHIADATAQSIKNLKLKKVGLLGTKFTMEQEFYKNRLIEKHNIDVVVPNDDDRNLVHKIIYNELCLGNIKDLSKQEYIRIINNLIQDGAEGIILGCTEIPLLIKQDDVSVPIFDTTTIHAEMAVMKSLE